MPQVKRKQGDGGSKPRGKGGSGQGKKATPARDAVVKQTTDASSIIMAVFLVISGIIGIAAWMGGSMSVLEHRVNFFVDGVVRTAGLSVKQVNIYHATPEQEDRIETVLDIAPGDSMFRADPKRLKRMLDAQRGLGDIEVYRFWPDQVAIVVTPLEAAVLFEGEEGDFTPIDPLGREVLEPVEDNSGFLKVNGIGAPEAVGDLVRDIDAHPDLNSRLVGATRVGERRWDLEFVSGVVVKLPAGEDREPAIRRLAALQAQSGMLDRRVATVDLRDPSRVYVQRGPVQVASNGGANVRF